MDEERPVPRQLKRVDAKILVDLTKKAWDLGLNRREPVQWIVEHAAPDGHYLLPAFWHEFSHRPEVSPHLRCEFLLQLQTGEPLFSLLDVLPADFERLPRVTSRAEGQPVLDLLRSGRLRTVPQWLEGTV